MLPGVKVGRDYRLKGSGGAGVSLRALGEITVLEQRASQRAEPISTDLILANLLVLRRA